MTEVVKDVYAANKQIVFDGDDYSDEWHAEAEQRGLMNLRTTPDALPWIIDDQTVTRVLELRRPLRARAALPLRRLRSSSTRSSSTSRRETAASIARTMILPAAARHLALLKEAGIASRGRRDRGRSSASCGRRSASSRRRTSPRTSPTTSHGVATYMRDTVIPAMDDVREVADRSSAIVADDLWPLPKYSEMLFIK